MASALRALAMDAATEGKSLATRECRWEWRNIAVALWKNHLRHNPNNPKWIGRDRFLLSNGHGSMLQYGLLHLSGYDLSLDDLKNFKSAAQQNTGTSGVGVTPGVETSTGPLWDRELQTLSVLL